MIQMHDCAAQVRGLVASRCGLTFLNRQSTRGDGACHLCVDATGRTLLVANYGSGSVAALPIGADGSLGEPSDFFQHEGRSVDAERQEGPHAHSITLDGANRHALVADLGLDQILLYELDAVYGSNRGHDSIVRCDRPRSRRARARLPEVDAGRWIAAPRADSAAGSGGAGSSLGSHQRSVSETTRRIAAMCSGPDAQQPPMICAPIAFQSAANSASREGL